MFTWIAYSLFYQEYDMVLCGYQILFLLGRFLGVEWLDHMLDVCLVFLRNCQICFLERLCHFTFSLQCLIVYFSISSPTLSIVYNFNFNYSSEC